jgi:hypothetical protein
LSSVRSKHSFMIVILVALFAWGLVHLLLLRFDAGDVYPPYSSLRSDPIGVQALYEGLHATAHSVQRNFLPFDQVKLSPDQTLLICGLSPGALASGSPQTTKLMERLADGGGRVVITFAARNQGRTAGLVESDGEEIESDGKEGEENEERHENNIPADQAWENDSESGCRAGGYWKNPLELAVRVAQADHEMHAGLAWLADDAQLTAPEVITWPGALYFELQSDRWRIIYARDDVPVIAERPWGRGTLVLVADSYLFSNEAMRNDRFPGLLTWLLPPGHAVIFDEFHNGLIRQPGIASLARKYGLHGVFGVVLLVAVLSIWQQATVFGPGRNDTQAAEPVPALGPDAAQGMVNLMQQHIPPKELIAVCLATFRTSAAAVGLSGERLAEISEAPARAESESGAVDPVPLYRHMCQLLQKGKIK